MSSSALARESTVGVLQLVGVDASPSIDFRAAKNPAGVGVALAGRGRGAMVNDNCSFSNPLLASSSNDDVGAPWRTCGVT